VRLYFNGEKIGEKISTEGVVVFENLCEGKYSGSIIAEGMQGIEFNIELGCNETKELHKELESNKKECCDGVIYYVLKDSTDGKAINEAEASLFMDGKFVAEKYTNGDGILIFTDVCEGKYQISTKRNGYKAFEFNFDVECNDTLEITKYMNREEEEKDSCCTAILKIIIIDSETLEPIANTNIVVEGKGFREEGTTDSEGEVHFDGLCAPREYAVIASIEGYITEDLGVGFEKCFTHEKTIKLIKK
jgi:hypothetical protein